MDRIVYGATDLTAACNHASVMRDHYFKALCSTDHAKPFLDRLMPLLFLYISFVFLAVGVDLGEAWSLKCRGIVYGVIGKIQFFPGMEYK